jgi:asparagine synthase (glutamine-hydrolysing)
VSIWGEGGDQALGLPVYNRPTTLRGVGWRHALAELPYYRKWCQVNSLRLLFRAYLRPMIRGRPEAWARRLRANKHPSQPWLNDEHRLSSDCACNLDAAYAKPRHLAPAAQVIHQTARSSYNVTRYSALDVTMAYAGVEWRLPYLDRRLVEFMLHLPHRLVAWRGTSRVILCESMRGTLPETVRVRTSKSDAAGLYQRGLVEEHRRIDALLEGSRAEALGFFSAKVLRQAIDKCRQDHTRFASQLKNALCLEAWLRAKAH